MKFMAHHIELDGGVSPASGAYRFFVDMVECDGARLTLWDGASYAQAIHVAECARMDWCLSLPVKDVVVPAQ